MSRFPGQTRLLTEHQMRAVARTAGFVVTEAETLDVEAEVRGLSSGSIASVANLVERARAGERWASEALYRQHARSVTRVATYLMGRTPDADDVVQDAFIRAFERLDSLQEPAAFGGWVCSIAANFARTRLRRRKMFRVLGLDRGADDAQFDQLLAPGASPEEHAEIQQIARALESVGSESRVAWMLRNVEGWELAAIAAALGISLATTKRRISAADDIIAARFGSDATAKETSP